MKFKEFGSRENNLAVFYYGACTYWQWYIESIRKLSENYFVVVPVYDGYGINDDNDFTSVEETVKETADYIKKLGYTKIDLLYGLSMGGGMAVNMLALNYYPVKRAVIDAGMTPYNLPYVITKIIEIRDYIGISILRGSMSLIKKVFDPKRWTKKDEDSEYKAMYNFLRGMSSKTILNTFYSANNYKMPEGVVNLDTDIEYWYGSLEKKDRKYDIKYIGRKFKNVKFREIKDMEHGELVMMHPAEFIRQINN